MRTVPGRDRVYRDIVELIYEDRFPFYVSVQDVDREHKSISKMLMRRGLKSWVIISKDYSKNTLWFSRSK